MNYTIYYPLTEKYLSLYPQEKKREIVNGHNQNVANNDDDVEKEEESGDEGMQTSEDDKPAEKEEGGGEKPPMWEIIKKCMANKTLDKLRDGKLNIRFDGKPIQGSQGSTSSNVSKETGKEKAETGATTRQEKEEKRKKKVVEVEQPKEEEEDSDGGFFEE